MGGFLFVLLFSPYLPYTAFSPFPPITIPPKHKSQYKPILSHYRASEKIKNFFNFFSQMLRLLRFFPYRAERQTAKPKRNGNEPQGKRKANPSLLIASCRVATDIRVPVGFLTALVANSDYPSDLGERQVAFGVNPHGARAP